MGVHRTCGEPSEIKKNNHPENNIVNARFREQVSVSDTPCTAAGCPGGTVCAYITTQNRQWVGEQWATGWAKPRGHSVDCKGAVGRYVRVHLPGKGRILAAQVSANKAKVASGDPNQLVCYAVEGRISTTTKPEYVTTDDPEDPVYYSTCYVRGPVMSWLPPQTPSPTTPVKWNLGENTCLDCESYRAVQRERQVPNSASAPLWTVVKPCRDCESPQHLSALVSGSDLVTCGGGGGGSGGGTAAAVVILLMLGGVVGGYVYYRKKHGLPLQPGWLDAAKSYTQRHRASRGHGGASDTSDTSDTAPMCEGATRARPPPVPVRPGTKAAAAAPPRPRPPSRPQPPTLAEGHRGPAADTAAPCLAGEPANAAKPPPSRPPPPASRGTKAPPARPAALPRQQKAALYKAMTNDPAPTVDTIRPPPMEEPAKAAPPRPPAPRRA